MSPSDSWFLFMAFFLPLVVVALTLLSVPRGRRHELWQHWLEHFRGPGSARRDAPGKDGPGSEPYANKDEPPITLGPRPLHPRTTRHRKDRRSRREDRG